MANEFNYFDENNFDHFTPKATGNQFDFLEDDAAFEEKGYGLLYDIDQEMLIQEILKARRDNALIENFNYKKYRGKQYPLAPTDKMQFDDFEPQVRIHRKKPMHIQLDGKTEFLNNWTVILNKRTGRSLDPYPYFQLTVDLSRELAKAKIIYTFKDAVWKEEDLRYILNGVYTSTAQGGFAEAPIIGVIFETHDLDEMLLFNQKIGHHFKNIEAQIESHFYGKLAAINDDDYETLNNFFSQAPRFYLRKLDTQTLLDALAAILQYDVDTWIEDNSSVMIKVLSAIFEKEGGSAALYDYFNSSPEVVKKIYHNMDHNGKSELFENEPMPHKTIFSAFLLLLCNDNGQGYTEQRVKTDIYFDVTTGHEVDSNIWDDDKYIDKYDLTQQHYKEMSYFDMITLAHLFNDDSFVDKEETLYLHPLDLVTLKIEKDGVPVELVVPVIYVKDIAYHSEWEAVMRTIRFVVNIIVIVISIATLTVGATPFFTALSLIDLGLATGDVAIQAFADEIRQLKYGQEFLDAWDSVYGIGGLLTGLPALGQLLRSGGKLLTKVGSAASRRQLVGMLVQAATKIPNLPKFVKGKFIIITKFLEELQASTGFAMRKLNEAGAILIKGNVVDATGFTYLVTYRGIVLFKGNRRVISNWIKGFRKLRGDELVKHLDDGAREAFEQHFRNAESLTAVEKEQFVQGLREFYGEEFVESWKKAVDNGLPHFWRQDIDFLAKLRSVWNYNFVNGSHAKLPNVLLKPTKLSKVSPDNLKQMRKHFNSIIKKNFLKSLGNNPNIDTMLIKSGFKESEIATLVERLKSGKGLPGHQVHHKIPIDLGGSNDFSNLVLMKQNPYHAAVTSFQNSKVKMSVGQVQTIEFPLVEGTFYSPPYIE